jgi:hypothetical protein
MKDDLFYGGDPLADLSEKAPEDHFIGCPLDWFKLVFPLMHSKKELAVALYVYRLHKIRRSRTVLVSNERLLAELGINRFVKYRALRRLADAGIIKTKSHGAGPASSVAVTFLVKRKKRREA